MPNVYKAAHELFKGDAVVGMRIPSSVSVVKNDVYISFQDTNKRARIVKDVETIESATCVDLGKGMFVYDDTEHPAIAFEVNPNYM